MSSNIRRINPVGIFDPSPFGFCHSTSPMNTNGRYVFISGQSGGVGADHTLSDDFRSQVQSTLQNLCTVLKANDDLTPADVLKITVLIVDHTQEKLSIWTEEMLKVWGGDGSGASHLPASTLIPVPRLALDGMLIEVDAVAFKAIAQQ